MSKFFAMAILRSVYYKKTVIYNCIAYVDGHGDVANVINVAYDMLPITISCLI